MKKEDKIRKNTFVIMIAATITLVLTSSFALFTYFGEGQEHKMTTGTLVLNLTEDNSLTLANTYPMSDKEALTTKAYTFKINNIGTEDAKYKLSIIDDATKYERDGCSSEKLPWSVIKYSVKKNDGQNNIGILADNNGIIDSSTIKANSTDNYEVRLWISSTAGNEIANLHLHAKIKIQAILTNRTNYETGA